MRIRRSILATIVMLAILACAPVAFSSDTVNGSYEGFPIVRVYLDGKEISFDVPAVNFYGRTLVPVRFVAENMGAKVIWDEGAYAARIVSKGILGSGEPIRSTPDKGALSGLTDDQVKEAITYGVSKEGVPFEKAFEKYIAWDEESHRDAFGILETEYSYVAVNAYFAATDSKQIPTVEDALRLPKGMMTATICFNNQWPGTLDKYRFYVRQGSKIAEASVIDWKRNDTGIQTQEALSVYWFTDGMDLSLPIQVIVAKPDGSSYTFKWNLFELR